MRLTKTSCECDKSRQTDKQSATSMRATKTQLSKRKQIRKKENKSNKIIIIQRKINEKHITTAKTDINQEQQMEAVLLLLLVRQWQH